MMRPAPDPAAPAPAPAQTDWARIGADVIRQEACGLTMLAERIAGGDHLVFHDAVATLVATRGRVVVSGMGKSGLICRKIAATLSATGTPALFIHPAEAGHGDLGSLQKGDCLMLVSNSGATRELGPLLGYAAQINVPLIAIASDPQSPLMRAANIALCLPKVSEACPQRIAPTTSTTMMLALGDALALAAMAARGITRDDLVRWHPGGAIGWNASPLRAIVNRSTPLPLVAPDDDMRHVLGIMTRSGKGIAGVIDTGGRLVGVVTDGDIRRGFEHLLDARAADLMTRTPLNLPAGCSVAEARERLAEARVTVAFVVDATDADLPVGLVHIHDLDAPR